MGTYYNKYPYHFGVAAFSANITNLSYSIDDCSIFAIKCINSNDEVEKKLVINSVFFF